ncbi:MAG: hypothetical protein CSA26_00010 [Desulfobacterales bacterium]|nr:MAG: hypothetical protein CSA26_00010 [Desulfobacterales bacterium]
MVPTCSKNPFVNCGAIKPWSGRFLKKWFWWATHSRLKPMRDFAWMFRRHEQGFLNYFKLRIDNGMVEGLNNKAKVVSHRAYGYRASHMYITALYDKATSFL